MEQNKLKYSTLKGAEWFDKLKTITIGGLGSIGSWLSLYITRTGNHTLLCYEYDKFETKNLGGQFVTINDINHLKFDALKKNLQEFSNFTNIFNQGKFEKGNLVSSIVFSAFDNINSRKDMFETWLKLDNREIFIDGRMDFENFEIYAILPKSKYEEWYKKTLIKSEHSKICTLSSTSHVASTIASFMVGIFLNYISSDNIRMLPYKIRFNFINFTYKVEYYEV